MTDFKHISLTCSTAAVATFCAMGDTPGLSWFDAARLLVAAGRCAGATTLLSAAVSDSLSDTVVGHLLATLGVDDIAVDLVQLLPCVATNVLAVLACLACAACAAHLVACRVPAHAGPATPAATAAVMGDHPTQGSLPLLLMPHPCANHTGGRASLIDQFFACIHMLAISFRK